MIIEDLIRTGRLLLLGGMSADDILLLLCDAQSPQVRNFYQHVFVVEIPDSSSGSDPAALPMQVWGSMERAGPQRGKEIFQPDTAKAIAAPFVFPKGGNPVHPQGVYGIPAFIVFERDIPRFQASAEALREFLTTRLRRCPSLSLTAPQLNAIADDLHRQFSAAVLDGAQKSLCLILLADVSSDAAPYELVDGHQRGTIGASVRSPGRYLVPRGDRVLEWFWAAKAAEGQEKGHRSGACSVCGSEGHLVSMYCKAWPWFLPTWNCPLPEGGNEALIIESVALDEGCYRAMNLGACYFDRLTQPVDFLITRELFSPVADREAQRAVQARPLSDLPAVFGSVLLLPLLDDGVLDADLRDEFAENLCLRLQPQTAQHRTQRHIDSVVGFETAIPEDLDDASYRLTLIYFSGDRSRGDVHLRAVIEDVIPSVMQSLLDACHQCGVRAGQLLDRLFPAISDKQRAFLLKRVSYLPYLLARAYGGAYLWDRLQQILHRRPLELRQATRNAAHRMNSLIARLPKTDHDLREEVFFYLTFVDLLQTYRREILEGGESPMGMRTWKELLESVFHDPVEELDLERPAELGFACGALVRQFSRQYWQVTKVGRDGKDYLKHRILTFGSDLSPDAVWSRALPGIFSMEEKFDKLHLNPEFKQRVGAVLFRCEQAKEQLRASRDSFMAGFWSGYSLQGSERKPTDDSAGAAGPPAESVAAPASP